MMLLNKKIINLVAKEFYDMYTIVRSLTYFLENRGKNIQAILQ
ncbi:hypothetical protein BJV85_001277 [Clostridium acetobutylicum]|nr:hypothetical protein [Clostridium acetobutylicum]NOV88312.1 hypothetical protein [Clostridium acetobutylicum]NOW13344.1 hypothetical protein [Clostridium acetobutylicum]NSA92431.1 hypothetical protein [Clostridium acetobutylicum]NYC93434.1 hypothetical protein [Clostridium acetobutylicum]